MSRSREACQRRYLGEDRVTTPAVHEYQGCWHFGDDGHRCDSLAIRSPHVDDEWSWQMGDLAVAFGSKCRTSDANHHGWGKASLGDNLSARAYLDELDLTSKGLTLFGRYDAQLAESRILG